MLRYVFTRGVGWSVRRCGHKAVALLGGATGLVGDPSGKSAERPVLSGEQAARNIAGIRASLEDLLRNRPAAAAAAAGNGSGGVQDSLILNNIVRSVNGGVSAWLPWAPCDLGP